MNHNHQENRLTNQSTWIKQEDVQFEYALTLVREDCFDRWKKIASYVPGKTADEVRVHYQILVDDLRDIEAGLIELPSYNDDCDYDDDYELVGNKKNEFGTSQISFGGSEVREKPRKKGTPWTKDEHRKFLEGLAKYGKGDWRSISRISVVTRTPTQVASHAQKYFNRLGASPKERKRSSIHDITITTTDTTMVQPPPTPGNLYVAQGAQLPASPPTNLYNGQGVGNGAQPLPPQASNSNFYSGQEVGKSASPQAPNSNFYSGQEVQNSAPPLPPQAPTSDFYIGQGGGMTPSLPSPAPTSNFYVGQGIGMSQQQQMGYGYQQNFVYRY